MADSFLRPVLIWISPSSGIFEDVLQASSGEAIFLNAKRWKRGVNDGTKRCARQSGIVWMMEKRLCKMTKISARHQISINCLKHTTPETLKLSQKRDESDTDADKSCSQSLQKARYRRTGNSQGNCRLSTRKNSESQNRRYLLARDDRHAGSFITFR